MALPVSVFADVRDAMFSYRYKVTLHVSTLVGGTPTDPNVAEGWIRTKMGLTTDDLVKAEVERVMEDRGVKPEDAIELVNKNRHLTGFKRDYGSDLARADQRKAVETGFVFENTRRLFTPKEARATFGELLIDGRQVKAMLKEAAMIAGAAGHLPMTKWGKTSKAMKGFLAEHLFVEEERILLRRTEPDRIEQAFVHTFRGAGLKLEEMLDDVEVAFTLIADFDFASMDPDFFGKVFSAGEYNGLGASRSQGFGRFAVTAFERIESDPATTKRATKRAKAIIAEDQAREEARKATMVDAAASAA